MVHVSLRFIAEAELLAQSRIEAIRTPGPGGQKRDKTKSGIRITHAPSGLQVIAGESRYASENQMRAIRRLRLKLAMTLREPIELSRFEPPDWFLSLRRNRQIGVSQRHEHYAAVCGMILDLMAVTAANPATVGAMLGVSTTAIVKLLEAEPILWTEANRLRQAAGLKLLVHRK